MGIQRAKVNPPANSPTTICKYVTIPSLKFVCSTNLLQGVLAGFKAKMIGIIKA